MFDSLHHFLLIVEHGTFTEAARHAHLSQPALSASIRRLEEAMGARLLERGSGRARPTAEGEALLPRARMALAAVEDGRRAVAEVAGLHAGEVRLGAGPTPCTYLLPRYLAAFRARHPGVRFLLREAHNPVVWEGLHDGTLDLGVVTEASVPRQRTALHVEAWLDDPLVIVRGPGVDPDTTDFVTFPPGSILRELLDRVVPERQVVMELGSIAAIKGNVRAGVGKALVSRSAIQRDLAEGALIVVDDPRMPLARRLMLVHRGRDRLPPAAAAVRALLLGGLPGDVDR
ncbi:MAG: LysR family transcriptional regulator [Alphaproteobacteria bacterium]|nr:LysR family transcriptional regulator [Alphaproteobacteria bacterium]